MLAFSVLSLAAISIANAVPPSGDGTLSLLDIVHPESASALKEMIDNSAGHTYIKPDLSDVDLLKVSVIDCNDDSVVTYMEMATNVNAVVYRKLWYGEASSEPKAE